MFLTREEAKVWSEILKGFSEGKEYQIPFVYDNEGKVLQYVSITDFTVNKQYPTICMEYGRGGGLIPVYLISEVKK